MDALRSVGRAAKEGAKRALGVEVFMPVVGAVVFFVVSGFAVVAFAPSLVLPLVIGLFLLGSAVGAARADAGAVGSSVLAGLCVLGVIATPIVGVWMCLQPGRMNWGLLALGVGVPCFSATCGPFLATGPHLLRRQRGLSDALGRALAGATVDGFASGLWRGAAVGLAIASVPLVVLLSFELLPGLLTLLFACMMLALIPAWIVGFAGACADEDDERLAGTSPRSAALHLFFAPSIALLFALAATVYVATSTDVGSYGSSLWVLVVGGIFFAIGLLELARSVGLAKRMGSTALRRIPGRVRLAGDTVFDKGATISATGSVVGEAQFVSEDGSYAFSLPSQVRLMGVEAPIETDTPMVLVLEGVPESLSLRDGRAPWPRGAMLTIGSQEETARVAMDERSRAVGLWGFAATLVFVVATGLLIGRPLF